MNNAKEIFYFFHTMGLDWMYEKKPRNRFEEEEKKPPVLILEHSAQTTSSLSSPSPSSLALEPLMPRKQLRVPPESHPAHSCQSLDDLRRAIENFDGCALKQGAKNTVFSDGNPKAKVMLVGEAPGADEDAQGKPFVGMSGQLLDKMMAAIGLDRTVVYISNIIPWRPPANRPPSTQEIAACLPFIERHIYLKQPKFLLLLGGVATKAILNNNAGIMRLRGHWQEYVPSCAPDGFMPIRTLPTFHPAFLLRSPNQKVYAWEDLKTLKAAVDEEGL